MENVDTGSCLRVGFEPLDDALTHLVDVFPLDLKAGGLDATEHLSIRVNLAQTRQQERERLLAVGELVETVGFEQVDVHVHADQLADCESLGRTVGTFEPPLFGNLRVIGKVLFAVFIDRATLRLTAIVIDLVEPENVVVEQVLLHERLRIGKPPGKSPFELERLSVDHVIAEITEPLVNALTVLKDVHVLELKARQHGCFELLEVCDFAYLRHCFLLGVWCALGKLQGRPNHTVRAFERTRGTAQNDRPAGETLTKNFSSLKSRLLPVLYLETSSAWAKAVR